MSTTSARTGPHPVHGAISYLQLPAVEVAHSASFYADVFGWAVDGASFEAPNLIGQWSTELAPAGAAAGPVLWLWVDQLGPTLQQVEQHGGTVVDRPSLDHGRRWLVEIVDPAGNRIGVVAGAQTARAQTMLAVRDVEATSRWYQHVLGLLSDHGGPHYERLLSDGQLILQLHKADVHHHHGPVIAEPDAPVGNGVLVWLGEVADFDGAVARATELGAPVLRPPHRNPPEGQGNGPGHREIWLLDPEGYTVVIASPDGEAWEAGTTG